MIHFSCFIIVTRSKKTKKKNLLGLLPKDFVTQFFYLFFKENVLTTSCTLVLLIVLPPFSSRMLRSKQFMKDGQSAQLLLLRSRRDGITAFTCCCIQQLAPIDAIFWWRTALRRLHNIYKYKLNIEWASRSTMVVPCVRVMVPFLLLLLLWSWARDERDVRRLYKRERESVEQSTYHQTAWTWETIPANESTTTSTAKLERRIFFLFFVI